MSGGSSWHSGGDSWTLRGGLREARIGGIGYVLISCWVEKGEDFAADGTGAIE